MEKRSALALVLDLEAKADHPEALLAMDWIGQLYEIDGVRAVHAIRRPGSSARIGYPLGQAADFVGSALAPEADIPGRSLHGGEIAVRFVNASDRKLGVS